MVEKIIEGFIRELRERGLEISPAERIEASRAVLHVGLHPRATFRAALRTTLAKDAETARVFDQVFEVYFKPPRARGPGGRGEEPAAGGTGGRAAGAGSAGGPRRPESPPEKGARRPPGRPALASDERAAGERKVEEAPFRQRPLRVPGRRRRLATERERRRRDRGPTREPDTAGRPRPGGVPVRRRDLRERASPEVETALAREIPAIIQEIRLRKGRRFRAGPRGRLWVKRMIRESLRQGGVPFTLPMKERRPRRPRVVLLVDVSFSVARAAALFTLICLGLSERIRRSSIYFFVDRMVDATDAVKRWAAQRAGDRDLPAGHIRPARARPAPGAGVAPRVGTPAFTDLLAGLPGLNPDAPSDYGRAFFEARQYLARAGGRDAVLVVLGDARTNRMDPLPWAFEEIAVRCRRVLWLNPEPRAKWDEDDAVMSAYLPYCDLACEVRDLEGLATGVREILRSL